MSNRSTGFMSDQNINLKIPTQENSILTDEPCLQTLNRLKVKIPEFGYQGLFDLCLLLETAQKNFSLQQNSAENSASEYREILLNEALELAEQHIQSPLDEDSIDDLMFAIIELCSNQEASNKVVSHLKTALMNDNAQQSLTPRTSSVSNNISSNDLTDTTDNKQQSVTGNLNISSSVPEQLKEFITMLQQSLQQVEQQMNDYLIAVTQSHSNQHERQTLADDLAEEINKFSRSAEIAGLKGLKLSCDHVTENINLQKSHYHGFSTEQITVWKHWHDSLVDFLQTPFDPVIAQKILSIHCSNEWLTALSKQQSSELLINLKTLASSNRLTDLAEQQSQSNDNSVSLQLPDDVHPELLDSLLEELPHLTEEFSESIQKLNKGGQLYDVYNAQRIAHTIKGAGNTVGIKGIANLTHHLEDILTVLADTQTLPDTRIINHLIMASDCLEEMSEALINKGSTPVDAQRVLQDILDLAAYMDKSKPRVKQSIKQTTTSSISEETQTPSQTLPDENAEQQIRVPVTIIDKLLQFSNQIMFINGQLREQLRQAGQKNRTMQNQLDLMYDLGMELEELVDIRNYDLFKNPSESAATDFDSLEMDQYNELHTCSRRIHEVATDIRDMDSIYRNELQEFDGLLMEQNQLNDSTHRDLLSLRMISVNSVIPRFQRSVRQTCRMTNKKADLQINGEDVSMDRDILNGIVDPLMHLLRNAVDHGIESSEQRLTAGKQEVGNINLSFRRAGNMIVIECQDDGAGLDLELIRNKGIQRGIINKASKITDEELEQLIFQPNFSTNETITQTSGRGVGMDVVASNIRSMGGVLRLNTKKGQGCVFNIELPLSLVHYYVLLVKVGSQFLALAEHSIEQILHPDEGILSIKDVDWTFEYEEQVYPVMTLDSLLTGVSANNNVALEKRTVILVQHLHTKYMVLIEEIIGVKEIVVKGFGQLMPKIHGVIGASILEDGSIAPVMDMQELLGQPSRWSKIDIDQMSQNQTDHTLYALIVDDSLSARRSLEQFVADLGFTIMVARDGQEAIEMIYHRIPDIVITDMEMPRINGIELTEFIRSNQDTTETPVVMITSRSTNKHKSLAFDTGVNAYLTKPYSEDELTLTIMKQVDISKSSEKMSYSPTT